MVVVVGGERSLGGEGGRGGGFIEVVGFIGWNWTYSTAC